MNISGIRPYTGLREYNSIESNKVLTQRVPDLKEQEQVMTQQEQSLEDSSSSGAKSAGRDSQDYAAQYRPGETYELKGRYSDLSSLDVEQAISTMQKDKVIHQYQFFVGESKMQNQLEQVKVQSDPMENFDV